MAELSGSIQIIYNTAANLASANYVLKAGQEAHESDTNKRKIGDGVTAYNSLGYLFTGSGSVTSVSVVSANGFAGTVVNPTTTPAITLSTSITGVLKGNGTAISAATDADITGKLITGYVSGAGTVSATDSILQAIQKLNGNIVASSISGLTTSYIPKATSATTIGDSFLSEDGTQLILANGKYITGADITKARISFGTSGSKITLQAVAGNYSKTYIEQDATSYVNIVSDAGVTNTYTINEMGRTIASWSMYDNVGATRSGIEVQNGSGATGYNVGGVSVKLATVTNAITANTDSKWATFVNARNATYNAGVNNSVIIGGNGRTATTDNTVYVPSLDVSGSLKYVDGNQGLSKVLTSDANGVATWQTYTGSTDIVTLGTIATGTWNATAIGTTKGGTGLTSYTTGDIIQATASNTLSALAGVSAGSYLRSGGVGTANVWSTLKLPNAGTANYTYRNSASNTMAESSILQNNGTTIAIGNGSFSASYLLNVEDNVNTFTGFRVRNSSSGTAASCGFTVSNDATSANFVNYSTGYTTSGLAIANSLLISKPGTNAQINIAATDAGGSINLITGASATANIRWSIASAGTLTATDAINMAFGTTTGTKIGTATSQKIGFWNTTPIVQPTTAVAASTLVSNGGTTLTDTDTFDGYTLKQVVKALRNTGILA